jgi:hypothetical protein
MAEVKYEYLGMAVLRHWVRGVKAMDINLKCFDRCQYRAVNTGNFLR